MYTWWGTNATTCCITTCQPARPVGPQTRDVTVEERVRRNTHTHVQIYKHTHTYTLSNSHTLTHRLTGKHTDLQTHTRARARAHTCIYTCTRWITGARCCNILRDRPPCARTVVTVTVVAVVWSSREPRAPSRQLLIRARERECNALVDDDDDDDCIKLHSAPL